MHNSGMGRSDASTRGAGGGLDVPADPRRGVVLALAAALFLFSQFYRVANAVVAPELQRGWRLSFAVVAAATLALAAVFWPWSGRRPRVGERLRRRRGALEPGVHADLPYRR